MTQYFLLLCLCALLLGCGSPGTVSESTDVFELKLTDSLQITSDSLVLSGASTVYNYKDLVLFPDVMIQRVFLFTKKGALINNFATNEAGYHFLPGNHFDAALLVEDVMALLYGYLNQVVYMSPKGEFKGTLKFKLPPGLAFHEGSSCFHYHAPSKQFFIATTTNQQANPKDFKNMQQISIFNQKGEYVKSFAKAPSYLIEGYVDMMGLPFSTVLEGENLYILNAFDNKIEVYDLQGEAKESIKFAEKDLRDSITYYNAPRTYRKWRKNSFGYSRLLKMKGKPIFVIYTYRGEGFTQLLVYNDESQKRQSFHLEAQVPLEYCAEDKLSCMAWKDQEWFVKNYDLVVK